MQQTTKYKLDLIEKTDAFSPDALNQNMEKVEAQFDAARAEAAAGDAAEAAARTAADTALDQRVVTLEDKIAVTGIYTGNGSAGISQDIYLGFTPVIVFVSKGGGTTWCAFTDHVVASQGGIGLQIIDGGFRVSSYMGLTLNSSGQRYVFLAFP